MPDDGSTFDLDAALDAIRGAEPVPDEPEEEVVAPGVVVREGAATGRTDMGPSGRIYNVRSVAEARRLFNAQEPEPTDKIAAAMAPTVTPKMVREMAKLATVTGQSLKSVVEVVRSMMASGLEFDRAMRDLAPRTLPPPPPANLGSKRFTEPAVFPPLSNKTGPNEVAGHIWSVLADRGVLPGKWDLEVEFTNERARDGTRLVISARLEQRIPITADFWRSRDTLAGPLDSVVREPKERICVNAQSIYTDITGLNTGARAASLVRRAGFVLGQKLLDTLTEAGVDLPDVSNERDPGDDVPF